MKKRLEELFISVIFAVICSFISVFSLIRIFSGGSEEVIFATGIIVFWITLFGYLVVSILLDIHENKQ